MSDRSLTNPDGANLDQALEAAVADYIRRCEAGNPPDRGEILQGHPEHADELRQFFAQRDRMNQLLEPIRDFGNDLLNAIGPGQQINYVGNYELLEEIARGGMGVVYKARQKNLGRIVAVKMILAGRFANQEDVKRFQIEAEAAANLQHPNIVPIHEVGKHEGLHYFSMDFVEGRSLSAILRENPLPSKQAATYVRQMAEAIHFAHQQGTLHRDLKPSNILIDHRDQIRITDFGLATRANEDSDLTRTGQIVGTPSYMPPEQAEGNRSLIGPGSDVYSLGAILYECLTGRAPFKADSVLKTIEQVIRVEAASPRLLNPEVNRDLETICLKCLEKEPHRRYGTAQLLAEDLGRYIRGEPILARPISLPALLWRWCGRKPLVAGLTASLLAAMVAIAATSTIAYFREVAHRREMTKKNNEIHIALESEIRATDEATRQRDSATQQLYVSQINLTQRAWDDNNVGRTREVLESLTPEHTGGVDLRGWEWHYLWRLTHSERRTLPFMSLCLAFSPDTQYLVSGNNEGTLVMWDTDGTSELRRMKAHDARINRLCFSGDGALLATAGADATVKLWETSTGREMRVIPGPRAKHFGLALSADGSQLAVGGNEITIWSTATGTEVRKLVGHQGFVPSMQFHHDGKRLLAGSWDRTAILWNVVTGERIRTFAGHQGTVDAVAISPDGSMIVAGSRDGAVKSWNIDTGQESVRFIGHPHKVNRLVFSNDGKRLASAGDDSMVKLWDTTTGEEIQTLHGHADGVNDVAFSRNGDIIASGSWDGTIRLWDTASGQQPVTRKFSSAVVSVVFRNESQQLAVGTGEMIAVTDLGTGRHLWMHENCLASREAGTSSITAATNAVLFDLDGQVLVTGLADGSVRFRRTTDGELLRQFQAHSGPVMSLNFSTDEKTLVTSGVDRRIMLWDAHDGSPLATLTGHTDVVRNVVFSPDGKFIASAGGENDKTVRLWDVATRREVRQFVGHEGGIFCVIFSRDSRQVFSGGDDDMIRVWEVETGRMAQAYRGHAGTVECLSLSPDGKRIASCGDDRTVRIWDVASGQELQTLKPDGGIVLSVAFSSDGTRVAAGSYSGKVTVWDARPLISHRIVGRLE